MAIMRYDPWATLTQLQNEMNRMFEQGLERRGEESVAASDWAPAVDIREDDDKFVIVADVPGVEPKDIEIHMENGILTIKGERETEKREQREGYKRIERAYGSFYRRFSLPDTADADRISAASKNGVLEIAVPKHEKVQPRKITVEG